MTLSEAPPAWPNDASLEGTAKVRIVEENE